MYVDMEDSDDDENHDANDIWEKEKLTGVAAVMRNKRGDNGAFLKKDFCKKYIAYCKNKIRPTLTDDAVEMIGEKYAQLRDSERNATLPITARCLETMIRLSSAHAKLRLSKKIEKKDVIEVLKVLEYALQSSNADQEEEESDEEMENDDDEMENAEEENDENEDAPQRKKRIPGKKKPVAQNRSKKRRAEAIGLTQKDIVTRQLARYYRTKKCQEVDLDDLHEYMTDNNKEIAKDDLKKIIITLDEEDKIFFVPNENKIHQV